MNLPNRSGIQNALIAISFFRQRHRRGKRGRDIGHYRAMRTMSLEYIYAARRDGWRGSIRAALKPSCSHVTVVNVSAFIYDQVKCADCGAYMGESFSS